MTPSAARTAGEELARRTRKAQGLPRLVRDPDAVRKVVTLLVNAKGGAG